MDTLQWWSQGDAVTQGAALVLLAMSVASWVIILWKAWLLHRAKGAMARAAGVFWQAPSLALAMERLAALDALQLLSPLVSAAHAVVSDAPAASLATQGSLTQRLTRVLRDALHGVLARLQFGQVMLATVGSTAPFVGLLGTVWGIYHALNGLAGGGTMTIDRIAGPVGEALVMTAAGLAVAIPAVLAYNWQGRLVGALEADLEGFALDLRELLAGHATPEG